MPLKLVEPVASPGKQDRRRARSQPGIREARPGYRVAMIASGASLNLVPPGSRRGNRFWLARGTLADGSRIKASSKTDDREAAKHFVHELATSLSPAEACRHAVSKARAHAEWMAQFEGIEDAPDSFGNHGGERAQAAADARGSRDKRYKTDAASKNAPFAPSSGYKGRKPEKNRSAAHKVSMFFRPLVALPPLAQCW